MSINCDNFFTELAKSVDDVNLTIIDNMTDPNMKYDRICLQNDVTSDFFYETLTKCWHRVISDFSSHSDCGSSSILPIIYKIGSMATTPGPESQSDPDSFFEFLFEAESECKLDLNVQITLFNLSKVYMSGCKCHKMSVLKNIGQKYFQKYFPIYASDPEVRSYVMNKLTQILDHIDKHLNTIDTSKLKNPELVNKLKSQLSTIKTSLSESFKPKSNVHLQHALDQIRETVQKIRESDTDKIYSAISAKVLLYVETISEYLRMIFPAIQERVQKAVDQINPVLESATKSAELIPSEPVLKDHLNQIKSNIITLSQTITADKIKPIIESTKQLVADTREKIRAMNIHTSFHHENLFSKLRSELKVIKYHLREIFLESKKMRHDLISKIKSNIKSIQSQISSLNLPDSDVREIKQLLAKISKKFNFKENIIQLLDLVEEKGRILRHKYSNSDIVNTFNKQIKDLRSYVSELKCPVTKENLEHIVESINNLISTISSKVKTGGNNTMESIQQDPVFQEIRHLLEKIKTKLYSREHIVQKIDILKEKIKQLRYKYPVSDKLNIINQQVKDLMAYASEFKNSITKENLEHIKSAITKSIESIKSDIPEMNELKSDIDQLKSHLANIYHTNHAEIKQLILRTKAKLQAINTKTSHQYEKFINIIMTKLDKIESHLRETRVPEKFGSIVEHIKQQLERARDDPKFRELKHLVEKININDSKERILHELHPIIERIKILHQQHPSDDILNNLQQIKTQLKPYMVDLQSSSSSLWEESRRVQRSSIDSIKSQISTTDFPELKQLVDKINLHDSKEQLLQKLDLITERIKTLRQQHPSDSVLNDIHQRIESVVSDLKPELEHFVKSLDSIQSTNPEIQELKSTVHSIQSKLREIHLSAQKEIDVLVLKAKAHLNKVRQTDLNVYYKNIFDKVSVWLDRIKTKISEVSSSVVPQTKSKLDSISEKLKSIQPKNTYDKQLLDKIKSMVDHAKNKLGSPNEIDSIIRSIQTHIDQFARSPEFKKLPQLGEIKTSLSQIQQKIMTGGHGLEQSHSNIRNNIKERINVIINSFTQYINSGEMTEAKAFYKKLVDSVASKLTMIYGFSVGGELDKLIPDELGSLKTFFIRVISVYYENLHPIIWAQILKSMINNFMVDLPHTPDELFQFCSKYLLLNSGPFILKILQMIRPVLSPELATKYNLTKLSYPLLNSKEIGLIFDRAVIDWSMYKIMLNASASVGHVCIAYRTDNPTEAIVIKVIKPVSIAQTCWEYKTLYDVYPSGSCERSFVQSIIKSNGRELNSQNEMKNIKKGNEYYTGTYADVFGYKEIDAKIASIENKPGVVKPECWYALAMTMAPGMPLSKLIEADSLTADTPYRANLHRCLDLLMYKFILGIIKGGFYHGDLHGGNIFYSFSKRQLTLIDWGSVGELDIFSTDSDTLKLIDIIVMSVFYNFDGILDVLTDILNTKCVGGDDPKQGFIDKNSTDYVKFKSELHGYREQNIRSEDKRHAMSSQYKLDLFSPDRIKAESKDLPKNGNIKQDVVIDSVYSYLELNPPTPEVVVKNEERDVLPVFTHTVGDHTSLSFSGALSLIIKFYATSGINIAIKFTEFYEFQKGYALLLGVLNKTGYSSYRLGMAMKEAIIRLGNIPELSNVSTVYHAINTYRSESAEYEKIKKSVK